MRRLWLVMLMLAVVGITSSCEKEPALNNEAPEYNTNAEVSNSPDKQLETLLVGRWGQEFDQGYYGTVEVVFRFYDTGKGYRTSDTYAENGSHLGYARGAFEYWVEDGILYIKYGNYEPGKLQVIHKGDSIVLTPLDGDDTTPVELMKQEDADYRFWGSWYIQYKKGDYYYDDNIKFVTSTDCYTYYSKYDNPLGRPIEGPTRSIWYKYKFDNNTLYLYHVEAGKNASPASTMQYRLEGTKLYLNGSATGGEWWCYSNFYEENGLEFRP